MTKRVEQITSGKGRKYVVHHEDGSTSSMASVTTILGALPKGGLDWWGFKLGLQAAVSVMRRGQFDLDPSRAVEVLYEDAKQTPYAPHKALNAAASRGTDVHALAEKLLLTGTLDDLPAGTKADPGYVDALVRWYTDFGVSEWESFAVESRLYSIEHEFAGTADLIARRPDGVYVIADFKTSKGIYESHLLQGVAYECAARELGVVPPDAETECHVIRLGVDGRYEVQRSRHVIDDFLAVQRVHKLLKDKSKKGQVVEP
jgi:hypothetical protein